MRNRALRIDWRTHLHRARTRLRHRFARTGRLLLVAWYDPDSIGSIVDNINAIARYSRHRFEVLNLYRLLPTGEAQIPPYVDLNRYEGIFVHCTVSYNPDILELLDRRCTGRLADFTGAKIVMKQDEHFRTNQILRWLETTGVDLILTCLSPETIGAVYPPQRFPRTRFLPTLTGYVTDRMRRLRYSQGDDRPIDIGYRGSRQPLHFGRLSWEKHEIAEAFVEICRRHNLVADISSRWEDRIFGNRWFSFLGQCKGTIGVESGASLFDFTGELERRCEEYLREHPDAGFENLEAEILAPHHGTIAYNQVSPRHFEAAACHTVQILYEGQYSHIFTPWRHYYPLKRDKTNLDEILARFSDRAERIRLARTAFEEIILNDRLHYAAFVRELDDAIDAIR